MKPSLLRPLLLASAVSVFAATLTCVEAAASSNPGAAQAPIGAGAEYHPMKAGNAAKPEKPPRIAQGQTITLSDHLVKGKITIVDFTSDYCPPCRAIAPKLDELHRRRDDLAVVKVDINRPDVRRIDWQSPVAQQFALRSVPHFKIFDGEGKLIAEGNEARQRVNEFLAN